MRTIVVLPDPLVRAVQRPDRWHLQGDTVEGTEVAVAERSNDIGRFDRELRHGQEFRQTGLPLRRGCGSERYLLAMAISESEIAQVRSATDIVALISETVALKKSGRRWTGLCRFTGEDPVILGERRRGRYYCFGCRASGDQITFVREIQHLDFMDALRLLADRAGIELHDDANAGPARKERQEALAAMDKAVTWYHERLLNAPDADRPRVPQVARHRRRHRAPVQTRLAPDEWDGLAKGLKFTEKVLMDTGLGFVNKGDRRQDAFERASSSRSSIRWQGDRRWRSYPAAALRSLASRWPRRGEVQELTGDLDLLQASHALCAQLGQGRRHQVRRDHRL